jgi:hypothetical protein
VEDLRLKPSPLTKLYFSDISNADASHFGFFTDFQSDRMSGNLPAYAFPELAAGGALSFEGSDFTRFRGEHEAI